MIKNVQGENECFLKNGKTRCFMDMLTSLRQPGNGSQNRVQLSEVES